MTGSQQIVPAGSLYFDAAFPPPAQVMADAGAAGIMRYYAPANNGTPDLARNPKNMKPWEPAAYAAAGLTVGINGEWDAATMLRGTGPNLALGRAVRAGCDRDGVPDDTILWWSMDSQCDSPFFDATRFAFDAYRATNPRNPFGLYSNSQHIDWALDEGYVVAGWIANAPWWSRTTAPVDNVEVFYGGVVGGRQFNWYRTPRAAVLQQGGSVLQGGTVDNNRIRLDCPFWAPLGAAPPTPPSPPAPVQEDEMASHVTYAQRADGSFVEVVMRASDGAVRFRPVGSIPGGAGPFYAVHPGGAGVNPIGDNECNTMGPFDAADDIATLARMLRDAGGTGGNAGLAEHHHLGGATGGAVAG